MILTLIYLIAIIFVTINCPTKFVILVGLGGLPCGCVLTQTCTKSDISLSFPPLILSGEWHQYKCFMYVSHQNVGKKS